MATHDLRRHAGAGAQIRGQRLHGAAFARGESVNGQGGAPPYPDPPRARLTTLPRITLNSTQTLHTASEPPPIPPPIHTPRGYIFFGKILFACKQPFTLNR